MIKIEFNNPSAAKVKYLKMVKPGVISRLKVLKKTLDDIKGPVTRVVGDNIDSYKITTKKLINLVADPALADNLFNAPSYKKTVTDYVSNPNNKLGLINLFGLNQLIDLLLDDQSGSLNKLLTCPVTDLSKQNDMLLKKFNLTSKVESDAIKLAFNYSGYSEITDQIKAFFRSERLVLYCPYCNMLEADYSEDDSGQPATIHYLDHFFDKATTPLLSYSMYNLVPCDGMCNGSTIKHTAKFEDRYHLSPYERGFDNKLMKFEAIIESVNDPVSSIHLNVVPKYGSTEYRRLVGDSKKINEGSKKGNINVFKLKSRYNRLQIRKVTGAVIRKLTAHINTRESLNSFLKRMELQQSLENYKSWYFDEFQTEFEEVDFHKQAFSKLNRDLHDTIVENSDAQNDDLKKFIRS